MSFVQIAYAAPAAEQRQYTNLSFAGSGDNVEHQAAWCDDGGLAGVSGGRRSRSM